MNFISNRRTFLKGSASLSLVTASPALKAIGSVLSPTDSALASPAATIGHPLLAPNLSHSLAVRCLSKPVLATNILDDMETDKGWKASDVVQLSYTNERARSGARSLRFTTLMRNEEFIRASRNKQGSFNGEEAFFLGQPFSAFATLSFDKPQDWTAFNRISLWCYLHPTVTPTTSLSLQFLCAGATAGPWDPLPINFIGDLKPGEWNHLTWEISEYQRDKVVAFFLMKPTSGLPLRTDDPSMTFDFDQLSLERVEVEPVSSWQVTSGKIAYSHFGYRPSAHKLAFCSEPEAQNFQLLNSETNVVIHDFPVTHLSNARGHYAVLDFTAATTPGTYLLKCGQSTSETFSIGDDAWHLLIDATLNTFQGFRCGCAVPGAHDACHLDTFIEYHGDRRCMAGGWHDAANNTQFSDSTQMSIYALLMLYDRLSADPAQARRAAQALDEAKWGLDWSLRMRFGPGLRLAKNFAAYWTDSKIGTDDDILQINVVHDLRENIYALVALSTSARILQASDPRLAARALKAAEEDYADIRPNVNAPITPVSYGDSGRGSWRDLAAYLAVSTVELFRATGKPEYKADALRFGKWLLDLQERSFIDGSPVTGYFYADAGRTQIQREVYGGSDDSGWLALRTLCEAFPDDPAWIDWYGGLVIYDEYYCRAGSGASAPFHVIPTTVWRRKDLEADNRPDLLGGQLAVHASPMFPTPPTEELNQSQRLQMYEAGTPLSADMRLRIFPIWYNHVQHGSTTGHLNRTAGLGCAAQVRGNLDSAELAARQLQWVVGANPFSRSIMFGVGYDYWLNFTVDNRNFVGGMGLGMNSLEADAPAWPNNAVFPYKEQWSYSTSRMAVNLAQCAAPALIQGRAAATVTIREETTRAHVQLPAGAFDQTLPPGRYIASCQGMEWKLDLVGGRTYQLLFDPPQSLDFSLEANAIENAVTIHAKLRGAGTHEIQLKLFNLSGPEASQRVTLRQGADSDIHWQLKVNDSKKPWIAVATSKSAPDLRKEVCGRVGVYSTLS